MDWFDVNRYQIYFMIMIFNIINTEQNGNYRIDAIDQRKRKTNKQTNKQKQELTFKYFNSDSVK